MAKSQRLKKELGFFEVYAVATGTTLSAGFFLLPGLAAMEAGPSLVLASLLAALPLIPAMLCIVELSTAMPRAGGVYYFVDRSLGPFIGLITGLGTWLALVLKVAFALVGMGAYIALFLPGVPPMPVALALAFVLGILNYFGARKSGRLQILLVFGLLTLLACFIGGGLPELNPGHFQDMFDIEIATLMGTAGLVYISYVGVTNVASLSEEIEKPEKNLPRGVFLSLATALLVYGLGTSVMVGIIPMERLAGDLTPAATAAGLFFGRWGSILLSIAAILAFVSVANAGIMSASRYPMAMSRDRLLPSWFNRLSSSGVPVFSLLVTVSVIVSLLILFDPAGIAKLASAFQLLMFAFVCLAVIIMRESRIPGYDPGYRSPCYPWIHLAGMVLPLLIIWQMGWLSILFTTGLVATGSLWYFYYARFRADRNGAIYHIFERLGRLRHEGLDSEMRDILKEKGLRDEDPFEDMITRCQAVDLEEEVGFERVTDEAAERLSTRIGLSVSDISERFRKGTRAGGTPVAKGVMLRHFRIPDLALPELVLVRTFEGVPVNYENPVTGSQDSDEIHAFFFLVSPAENSALHLRMLARIANRADDENFGQVWIAAVDEHSLRDIFLRHDRYLTVPVLPQSPASVLIGKRISEIDIPEGCRIVWIRHFDEVIIPRGDTVIQSGTLLTVIGEPNDVNAFRRKYHA
ncbi:MAG: amino acid permease [Gemmatimonadetes bacterium]|nr:amino acid permease [Gemmatimonadota bacterium]